MSAFADLAESLVPAYLERTDKEGVYLAKEADLKFYAKDMFTVLLDREGFQLREGCTTHGLFVQPIGSKRPAIMLLTFGIGDPVEVQQ